MSLHPGAGYTVVAALLVAFLGARLARPERRSLLTGLALFFVSLGLLALAGTLREVGLETAAGSLRNVALFGEGLCLIYLVAVLLFRGLLPAVRLSTPRIIQDVAVAAASLIWALFWLRANRVDLTSIVATSAVVTAVIAFSLQDTLGNILGGIAIQLDQSFQVGDWIRVNSVVGKVVEIRWRHTSLETREWETLVVPNSQLVKNSFEVLGKRQGAPELWRRSVPFLVDYRYPPSLVIETVQAAVRDTEIAEVAKNPAPICIMREFGESAASYAVQFWLHNIHLEGPVSSDIRQVVYFALQRVGIKPSIPAQAIFLTEETEERRKKKQVSSVQERAEALEKVDLFSSLQPDELEKLARELQHSPFARGALMTRQGDEADCLYLLVDGKADVVIDGPAGKTVHVAELGSGSIFGEMGLITGEPRSATVIARTAVDAYRLDREAFEEVLRSRPAIAQEISGILAQRRTELETIQENLDSESARRRETATLGSLLERIHSFFGLDGDEEERSGSPSRRLDDPR